MQFNPQNLLIVASFLMLICFTIYFANESMAKENLISNLSANITRLTTIQSFVDDYNEYSSICNRMQNDKAEILKKQCTQQGFAFSNYYVSYPSNDFLITCITPDGKSQIMRFRSS